MKIRHNIKRTGSTLSGHILETIFEEGDRRGNRKKYYTKDTKFYILSSISPELQKDILYVHGTYTPDDNDKVFFTYFSEQQAQQALDYINEFSVSEEPTPENTNNKLIRLEDATKIVEDIYHTTQIVDSLNALNALPTYPLALNYINEFSVAEEPKIEYVYVSSESEENALQIKQKRILITKLPGKAFVPYICVVSGDEDKYIKGELYGPMLLQYAVPIPPDKKTLREIWMTDAEYEKFIY